MRRYRVWYLMIAHWSATSLGTVMMLECCNRTIQISGKSETRAAASNNSECFDAPRPISSHEEITAYKATRFLSASFLSEFAKKHIGRILSYLINKSLYYNPDIFMRSSRPPTFYADNFSRFFPLRSQSPGPVINLWLNDHATGCCVN